MTLGRLIELYQAEQQGKQIIKRTHYYGYYSSHEYTEKVKLTDCDLKDLVLDKQEGESYAYFIKDEEDEYGYKLENYKSLDDGTEIEFPNV